jgi:hypothetical protein
MELLPTISLRPQDPCTLNRRAHQRERGQGEIAVNVHLWVVETVPARIPKAFRSVGMSMSSAHPSLALLHRAATVFRMQPRNPVLKGVVDVGRQSVDGAVFRGPPRISKAVAEIDRRSRDLGDLRHLDRSRFRTGNSAGNSGAATRLSCSRPVLSRRRVTIVTQFFRQWHRYATRALHLPNWMTYSFG